MRFLKLTNQLINIHYISFVKFSPSEISIRLEINNTNGAIFFGSGSVENCGHVKYYKIDKEKEDFKILENWINNQSDKIIDKN